MKAIYVVLSVLGVLLAEPQARLEAELPGKAPSLPKKFRLPAGIHPSSALETVQASTRQYIDTSHAVVLVKCTDVHTGLGPGGNIFTFYTFAVEETAKGAARQTVRLRLLGGTMGDTTIPMAIEPGFTTGSEYVLLLGPENAEGFATINPAAVFAVKKEPETGRKVVVPGSTGMTLYNHTTGRPTVSAPDWSFLDDFLFSVKQIR